ncbi:programmed cell death protein 7 [Sphaeramia orbicularis]|uniref:Programmed cell death 7 n=1 Tax=Sphaeramia orbicularis TaxID=375764 RepID=A0A672YAK6_9TELE|nr:programmed cell death protein 7 [Sphaeramia orbicularis]
MDNSYHHAPPDTQQPQGYGSGYRETPYAANRLPPPPGNTGDSPLPDNTAPPAWGTTQGYNPHPYAFRNDYPPPPPPPGSFGGPLLAPPYPFDPTVPPPPFGCPPPPPPGHFPNIPPNAPVNTYSSTGTPSFQPNCRPGPQTGQFDVQTAVQSNQKHYEYQGFSDNGDVFSRRLGITTTTTQPQPEDESVVQKRQDEQWVKRFVEDKGKSCRNPPTPRPLQISVPDMRALLYGAARLVSRLSESCGALKLNLENECAWTDSYLQALEMKKELEDKLKLLSDGDSLQRLKTKLSRIAKTRERRMRGRKRRQVEEQHQEVQTAEKEAAIDKWRMKKIHEVEERKKEQELKLAADSVLCEVRKKQADVKRMQDVLRSLEKLRKLRKEAASRKGIFTEQESDEAFSGLLEKLRSVMKKRTAVYSAEEKALMVMLEGEQEEERRRDLERRVKKEKEKQLQRKRRVDAMLFGDEVPPDPGLQPFREYYTQAEHSLHALVQIRREWDSFLVPADHPDGTPVPQGWVLPDPPSDQAWSSALQSTDVDCDDL